MHDKFSPSIMCSKPWDLLTYIKEFEKSGIDMIHYDCMDGHFVPNIMLGTETFKAVHDVTNIPLDLHIMCENPSEVLDYFDVRENDYVCFHPQTISASYKLLQEIKNIGAHAGIALNPGIPLNYIEELAGLLDHVLVMTVEPGYAGQKILPNAFDKIKRVSDLRDKFNLNFMIMCDGNCSAQNVKNMKNAGANAFVIGSALLNDKIKPSDFSTAFNNYKQEIYN